MTLLRLHLLGPPLVEQENSVVDIQRRKAQALLFYLAVTGEPQPREMLAALLWPEHDQQRAHGALRRHLSELNAALGGGWLATGDATVALTRPADRWVDLFAFQQQLALCRMHDHAANTFCPACIAPLTNAVTLYRGDFLAGFTLADAPGFDEWQFFQSEELRQHFANALERLAQAHLANNEANAALPYARRLLTLDQLHEPAHRQLMLLYAALGQQSAALRQYELCLRVLRDELDVTPAAETRVLYEQIRQGGATLGGHLGRAAGEVAPQNLPASTTPFIGRVKELADLAHLCQDEGRRLITILGPGGIGKTRLALEMAGRLVAGNHGRISFVRLAQLDDPANIIQAIAIALNLQFPADGRTPKQHLFDYLQQQQSFLVLDNFEHLLEGVGLIQELLQSCSTVRLLVTSRERLQLMGETLFTLGTLEFPTWEVPQNLPGFEAIQLFIDNAQRVRPHQPLHEDDMLYVARICRLVGGMPLGIILAASWIEVLSAAEIAAELAQGFDLLERELHDLPERQRSMRTVLAYSWQRLSAVEQSVFMRLALFRGGFTRAAAEEIAGATLATLARLVDKSFVQRTSDKRYDTHELLRQFAAQQLEAAGSLPALEEQHGIYYLNFLHGCGSKLATPEQVEVMLQLEADFENIRAAWFWAVQRHHYGLVDHALNALFHWFFWLRRSRQQEGVALLRLALQSWASTAAAMEHPVWGRIQARLLEQQGPWIDKPLEARARIQQALRLAQQQGNQAEISFCTWAIGLTLVSAGGLLQGDIDIRPAIPYFEECLDAYRARGDHFWLGQALEKLGHTYRRLDLCDLAVPLLQESVLLGHTDGDRFAIARSLRELAFARFNQGLEQETLDAAQEAYALQLELGDQQGVADSRWFLALCSLCCGDWQRARELLYLVHIFATEMNSALYQNWSSVGLAMAASIEESMGHHHTATPSFPNQFNAFMTRLCYTIYAIQMGGYAHSLQRLFLLATSDVERALCLLFTGIHLTRADEWRRAVMLLALALQVPDVAESWLLHLPEIAALQPELRKQLTPTGFAEAWQQGQKLDLRQIAAEMAQSLASDGHRHAAL